MINQLIGLWMYSGLIFQGAPIPKPSPELVIYFNFINQYENSIMYFRQGERGSCERHATYSVKGNQLKQTIIAVNEANADICSQDPDMQKDRSSITEYEIKDGQLYLHLQLGEDQLIYVWLRIY